MDLLAITAQLSIANGTVLNEGTVPGLVARPAPPKAARGREHDFLFAHLTLTGPADETAELAGELIEALGKRFFAATGSVTSALRRAVIDTNDQLLRRNLAAKTTREGALSCAVLHGNELFTLQVGEGLAFLGHNFGIERLPARPPQHLTPLGRSAGIDIRFAYHQLQNGDMMLFCDPRLAHLSGESLSDVLVDTEIESGLDELLDIVAGDTARLMLVEFADELPSTLPLTFQHSRQPARPCTCGGTAFVPETDVMDTWATSSLSPQIVGRFLADPALFQQVFPMTLRPQAHEIIRTWAFYTIVRSLYHTGQLPWQDVAISGWGLAADGEGKLSKSRGGGKVTGPQEMLARHSADAVRYWAAGTSLGKDAFIDEKRIQAGAKWVTKLWHVARFSERFLGDYACPPLPPADLTTADRWLLARLNQLIAATTASFDDYDYATARSEIEEFFWRDLADNYLEMAKKRLYDGGPGHEAARYTLYVTLAALLKLLAPLLPYVTDAIYRDLFAGSGGPATIHHAEWPRADERFDDPAALAAGVALLDIATAARRFKSERNLSPGAAAAELQLSVADEELRAALEAAELDLLSITRARAITFERAGNGTDWLAAGAVAIRLIL